MKFKSLYLLLLATLLMVAAPRQARAEDVSFEFFYDSLSPYGEWLEVGDYGLSWKPTSVDEDWAPYADGYWSYTDGGWTWVSYEEFGGITYHYGRWVKVEDEGWVWVPDYEWAPAWVSWRNNDENIGWAPLPPEARWQRDRGFSSWVDVSYDIAPVCYNFVRVADFGAPYIRPLLRHRRENVVIVENTVNITNISFNRDADCIFNGGPDYARVNRYATRPVPTLKLVRNTNLTVVNNTIINNNVRVRNVNAVQQGNQLVVVAPRVARPADERLTALVKPNVRRVVAQSRVTKGWSAMSQDQQLAVRAKMKRETRDLTPETAPARAVKTADLQMLPAKADPNAVIPGGNRKGRPRPGVAGDLREKPAVDSTRTDPALTTTPADPREVPRAATAPADPREAARAAREGALQEKRAASEAAKAAKQQKAETVPATPGADEKSDPRAAARATREEALQKRREAAAAAKAAGAATPTRDEAVASGGRRARPAIPATPAIPDQPVVPPVNTTATGQAATPDATEKPSVVERRRAAEAARVQASHQKLAEQQQAREAAQQRAAEQKAARQQQLQQQQQEKAAARQRPPVQADPAANVPDQQTVQQRRAEQAAQQQEAAQQRAAQAAAQRQRAAEDQQAARERAAGAAEARQRAAQQQQAQAAAAREQNVERQQALQQRQQAQAAAREQSAERAQAVAARQQALQQQQQAQSAARAQAAERNQARQQALQQQQQQAAAARQQAVARQHSAQPQPAQRQVAPAQRGGGKRKLTPEEAAAAAASGREQ